MAVKMRRRSLVLSYDRATKPVNLRFFSEKNICVGGKNKYRVFSSQRKRLRYSENSLVGQNPRIFVMEQNKN